MDEWRAKHLGVWHWWHQTKNCNLFQFSLVSTLLAEANRDRGGQTFNLPEFAGIFTSMTANAISGHHALQADRLHQYIERPGILPSELQAGSKQRCASQGPREIRVMGQSNISNLLSNDLATICQLDLETLSLREGLKGLFGALFLGMLLSNHTLLEY